MPLKKYTIAEFRKQTREAFNEVESGGRVFITRHSTRYELVKADIQGGKKQLEEPMPAKKLVKAAIGTEKQIDTIASFKSGERNGHLGVSPLESVDSIADIFDTPAEKIASDASASEMVDMDSLKQYSTKELYAAIETKKADRAAININTQDPDEIELGSQLTVDIDLIFAELRSRGVQSA